jgi:hypothetical protein
LVTEAGRLGFGLDELLALVREESAWVGVPVKGKA